MEHQAVGNRCAVILERFRLSITTECALRILVEKGFRVISVDMIVLARQYVGRSEYRRGARPSEAPSVVDCSSFMKWLYAQRGIWLPRRSIQQRELGDPVRLSEIVAGDIIFTSGWIDYYVDDPSDGVGHVGMATGDGTVIHAANSAVGVVETPLQRFVQKSTFRGVRRYIPQGLGVLTLETPCEREIETADDVKWIILQSLPATSRPFTKE